MIHLAVFSVGMPTASARTSAAAAEGASPTTEPGPWVGLPGSADSGHGGGLSGPGRPDKHIESTAGSDHRGDRGGLLGREHMGLAGHGHGAELGDDGGVHNRPVDGLAGGQQPRFGVEELLGGVDLAVARAQHARPVRALQVLRSTQ